MFCAIHRVSESNVGALPVAGGSLLTRQLQWLRAVGFKRVAVEVTPGSEREATVAAVTRAVSVGLDVKLVESTDQARLPIRELAARAGHPDGEPFVALAENVLGNCNLRELLERTSPEGAIVQALDSTPPPDYAQLRIVGSSDHPVNVVRASGWLVRVNSRRDALDLTCAILTGQLKGSDSSHGGWNVLVHAAEIEPGVWVSRHARVQPTAKLVAPVLIGPGAMVRSHAVVGPGVALGEGSVVSRHSQITKSCVDPETVIGENVVIENGVVMPHGVREFDTETLVPVSDKLLLTKRPRFGLRRGRVA